MKKILGVLLATVMLMGSFSVFGCTKKEKKANFDEKIATLTKTEDNGTPSWKQGDTSPVTLSWFINTTGVGMSFGSDSVIKKIQEETGITINFRTALTDDDQELTKMFTGGLTDIVTIEGYSALQGSMATQGYVYPIEKLAERCAPGMMENGYNGYLYKEKDIQDYYRQADGSTYGIPNFGYSAYYFDEQTKLEPNGAILVREDWYNQVTNSGIDMTSPTGFLQGMAFIKNRYKDAIPVQFDQFTPEGNNGILWLSQYFNVPFENQDGELIYNYNHENYKEMLSFVNDLYVNKYMDESNLSANYNILSQNIANGKVFCTIGTPQDYRNSYVTCYKNNIKYIPLVLRNSKGDDPVLQDLRGYGWLYNMISKDCKHPDRAIKLFDYLTSEEGQRLVRFGVEGEAWEWTDETKTRIRYTEEYIEDFKKSDTALASGKQYGLGAFLMLFNYGYTDTIKPIGEDATAVMKDYDIYMYNLKRPLMPYSYSFMVSFINGVTVAENANDYLQKENKVTRQYSRYLPELIQCSSKSDFEDMYGAVKGYLENYGLSDMLKTRSAGYTRNKGIFNITKNGYPTFQDGYVSPKTGANGDFSCWEFVTKN